MYVLTVISWLLLYYFVHLTKKCDMSSFCNGGGLLFCFYHIRMDIRICRSFKTCTIFYFIIQEVN